MKEKLYKRGGKVTHADLLVYHKRAQESKLKIKQKQSKNKLLTKCTFKPKTIDYQSDRKKNELDNNFDDGPFQEVKKPYSMPAKRLGKHRAFELYSLAKPRA